VSAQRLLGAAAMIIWLALPARRASGAEGELRLRLGEFLTLESGGVQALTLENRSSLPLRSAEIRCQFAALNQRTHLSEDIVGWGQASASGVAAGETSAVEVVEFHYEDRPPADHTHCTVEKAIW
jgi:hypothetical protein